MAAATKQFLAFALFNCEVSLESLAALCFSFYQPKQQSNVAIEAIVEKLSGFFISFKNSGNSTVNSLETLLQYVKMVALTLFDYLDIADLPNNEVSPKVKELFREHVSITLLDFHFPDNLNAFFFVFFIPFFFFFFSLPKHQRVKHAPFSEVLFKGSMNYLYHFQTKFRDSPFQTIVFPFGRWMSLLLVGLWKISDDPKALFSQVFSKVDSSSSFLRRKLVHSIDFVHREWTARRSLEA